VDEARRILGAEPDPPPRTLLQRAAVRAVREVLWVFIVIMNAGRRFGDVLLQKEYRLAGACHARGACCHHILLEWSRWFERFPLLGKLVLWKYTRIYRFFDRGYSWEIEEGLIGRVLGCHALLPDGRCGEYRLRPLICRSYPETPLMGRHPLLTGCGFRFERRDGKDAPDDEGLVQIGAPRRLSGP
jgi:Fe-S-cluster containining protein